MDTKVSNASTESASRGTKDCRLPQHIEIDPKSPLGVIHTTLREHIARLGRDQGRHKRQTTSITMLTVSLSSTSAVLLGLSFKDPATAWIDPVWMKNVALLFTAMIAVANAYDALYKPHRLWIREGKSYGLLKDLLLKIEIRAARVNAGEPVSNAEIEEYRSELARTLQDDLEAWVRQHGEELLSAVPPKPTEPPKPKP